jgi:hypothetical protein
MDTHPPPLCVDGTIDAHRAYHMTYNSHFDEVVLVGMWAEPGAPIGSCKLKLMCREGVMSFLTASVLLAWSVKASDCGPWSHAN